MSELTSFTLTHTRMCNMQGTSTKDAVLMFWQEHKCLLDISLTPISCTTPQRKRGSSYRRDRETRKCIIAHSLFLIHLGKQSVSSRQGTSSSPQTYKAIKLAAFNFFVQSSLHWLIYFFFPPAPSRLFTRYVRGAKAEIDFLLNEQFSCTANEGTQQWKRSCLCDEWVKANVWEMSGVQRGTSACLQTKSIFPPSESSGAGLKHLNLEN